jgi:hypothetical protein
MEGGPTPESNAFPQAPYVPSLGPRRTEKVAEQLISVEAVTEYKKYAAELIGADPMAELDIKINQIKQNPLPQVNQGEDIELLKLNDYIRSVNTAARTGDKTLFKKAVQHLHIFLG